MTFRSYRTSLLLGLVFTILLSAFWLMPQLAFIVFISLLLQLLLTPVVEWLAQHLPRAAAAGLVLLTFLALVLGLFTLVSGTVIPSFTRFIRDFPDLAENLQSTISLHALSASGPLEGEMADIWAEIKAASIAALKSSLTLLLSFFSRLIDLVIIFFVTFYLLKDGTKIKGYLAGLFPHRDYRRVLALFDRILHALRVYICSQLIICCLTAVVVFSYFTLRGIPYASVFAMVSGVAEFVPVLGPTVASVFGTLLTATQSPITAVQTAIFYLCLTQINHNVVTPTLIGKSLNLHPVAIILGVVLGGELLGAAGMFLAVPVIVIIKLVIEDIAAARALAMEKASASRWLYREKYK